MDNAFLQYAAKVISNAKSEKENQRLSEEIAKRVQSKLDLLTESLRGKLWLEPCNLTPNVPIAGAAYVLHAVLLSLPTAINHYEKPTYTDDEASKWRNDVIKKTRELQQLFARQPQQLRGIDETLRRSLVSKAEPIMEVEYLSTSRTMWPIAFAGLSSFSLIGEISKATQSEKISLSTVPNRPKKRNVQPEKNTDSGEIPLDEIQVIRLRFCLEMAAFFSEKVEHRHKIIAGFANLLFSDPKGSLYRASQVKRLSSEPFSAWQIAMFDAFASAHFLHQTGASLPQVIESLENLLISGDDK